MTKNNIPPTKEYIYRIHFLYTLEKTMDLDFSVKESEPNSFSRKVGCLEKLCYQYQQGAIEERSFLHELNNIESHPIDNENLFNQITAFYIIGLAYCFLKQKKLSPSTSYYSNEIVDKEIAFSERHYRPYPKLGNGILLHSYGWQNKQNIEC